MQIQFLLRAASRSFLAVAALVLLSTLPIHAQQQSTEGSGVLAAAPVPEQIALKNDRLFYVMANYTTVEHTDEFAPLSAKTSGLSETPFASVANMAAACRSRSSTAPITCG